MQKLLVKHAGGEYPVFIGKNLISNKELLRQYIRSQQIMLITDSEVEKLYLKDFFEFFSDFQCNHFILPAGESQKNLENLGKILDVMIDNGHHRDTTVIALGGGVINDISGFAAACYHRGVGFITIPTTLLCQIDASIGGKTAVNHSKGKNLIGAFHQPLAVFTDIHFLSTLPERHFRAGIAEIIKAAVIFDPEFFCYLENHLSKLLIRDPTILMEVIYRACRVKIEIVGRDEKEQNLRTILNFGHTFGHALENYFNYEHLLHGEAVALGMVLANNLSTQLCGLSNQDRLRINDLIERAGLPTRFPLPIEMDTLINAIRADKKILNNELRLILLSRIGQAKIVPVTIPSIQQMIALSPCTP